MPADAVSAVSAYSVQAMSENLVVASSLGDVGFHFLNATKNCDAEGSCEVSLIPPFER